MLVCDPVDPVVEHMGGVRLPLPQSEDYNTSAVVGREASIMRLVDDLADIVDHVVANRFAALADDFKAHPDHYLPPYQFPESAASEGGGVVEWSPGPGRKPGSTNVTRAFFWEQYKHAVDGYDGFPKMERPYRKSHIQPRTSFTYKAFIKYLKLWGPPPGYAGPGE